MYSFYYSDSTNVNEMEHYCLNKWHVRGTMEGKYIRFLSLLQSILTFNIKWAHRELNKDKNIASRCLAWHLILKIKIVSTILASEMKLHPELFCVMIYQSRSTAKWLTQLLLSLVGDVESNSGPSRVCACEDWCLCTLYMHQTVT